MTATYLRNLTPQDSDGVSVERPLTIQERLAQRERFFLEGPSNLSKRETRKRIAHDSVDERHQDRQD